MIPDSVTLCGITITKEAFLRARQESIDKWQVHVDRPEFTLFKSSCPLCDLFQHGSDIDLCFECPLHTNPNPQRDCCEEYFVWRDAYMDSRPVYMRSAAFRVLQLLRAISWDSWVSKYIKKATNDSITIDGVTISREQWEATKAIISTVGYKPVPDTWEAFVAANTKPEHVKNDNKEYSETSKIATLRPAIREDFMVTFSGVKVWMEKHDDERMREYFDGNSGSCFRWIDEWQITRNRAAGIMEMPKEFWKEAK